MMLQEFLDFQKASDTGVMLIWDAEQTYLQTGIEGLVLDNLRRFNKTEIVLTNTYQCYLQVTNSYNSFPWKRFKF